MSIGIQNLTSRKCQPCEKGAHPLGSHDIKDFLRQVPSWRLAEDGKSVAREFVMKDFMSAVQLIDRIAQIAEQEDHHPDLHLTNYRKLRIDLATHSIGGLSENDFILAAKIDQLPKELKKSS